MVKKNLKYIRSNTISIFKFQTKFLGRQYYCILILRWSTIRQPACYGRQWRFSKQTLTILALKSGRNTIHTIQTIQTGRHCIHYTGTLYTYTLYHIIIYIYIWHGDLRNVIAFVLLEFSWAGQCLKLAVFHSPTAGCWECDPEWKKN